MSESKYLCKEKKTLISMQRWRTHHFTAVLMTAVIFRMFCLFLLLLFHFCLAPSNRHIFLFVAHSTRLGTTAKLLFPISSLTYKSSLLVALPFLESGILSSLPPACPPTSKQWVIWQDSSWTALQMPPRTQQEPEPSYIQKVWLSPPKSCH